ncbi:MAG: glycosyltransferase family 4 protein [Candidatus Coatesbacteria bacterium]|nr:glycosyltransferase family 4 protein [Candidatus Coatesbacteria bacterium]
MRIGIATVSEAKRMGGIATYIRELLPHFALQATQHEFFVFRNTEYALKIPKADNMHDITFKFNINSPSIRRLYEQLVFPFLIKKYNLDLLHSIDNVIPFLYSGNQVVTIHDVTLFNTPDRFTKLKTLYLKNFVRRTVKKVDHIITISSSTKSDLIKYTNADESKITVIYESANHNPPCSATNLQTIYKVKKPYFIFIGTLEPGKNLMRMMRAFAQARKEANLPHKFVIVGGTGWKFEGILEEAKSLNLCDDIIFTKYVPLEDLTLLLKESFALLFASLYEGFGLPMVEAFEAGIPVLTSNISAMPEVAGNAALLVDPYDVNAIKEGIIRLARDADLRKSLIARGKERRKMFSWSQCAFETIKVYESFINM